MATGITTQVRQQVQHRSCLTRAGSPCLAAALFEAASQVCLAVIERAVPRQQWRNRGGR